jgi:hypothetical protein
LSSAFLFSGYIYFFLDSKCLTPSATIRLMNIKLQSMPTVETQTTKNAGMQIEPGRIPKSPKIQFQEIPIGQHFEFRGRRYKKLALSMASDEDRIGNIFQSQTEVLPDPCIHLLLTPEAIGPTPLPRR